MRLSDPSSGRYGAERANYISTCNICRLGVYRSQKWMFSRRPLGICHFSCVVASGERL